MKFRCFIFLTLFLTFSTPCILAQETTITGRVTEKGTNEGMPFVNIFFKGTFTGTVTDFEGYYTLLSINPADSMYASYLGYKSRSKRVKNGVKQVINFQLEQDIRTLEAVEIKPGVNPAHRIVRNVMANKSRYNPDKLEYIHFDNYTKEEGDIDNVTERMRRWKIFKPLTALFDNMDSLVGEDSKPNLPVYMSEIVSEVYIQKNPARRRENVKAVNMRFVGMEEGNTASQLQGSNFSSFNFYNENSTFFEKEFLSPFANTAFLFYEYYLYDSLVIDQQKCYKIKVKPKNNKDLLFTGFVWIADSLFAVKQADLEIAKEVNLNYIERIRIQQELVPTSAGPWFPAKTKMLVDFSDISKNFVSLLFKSYQSTRTISVNIPPEEPLFFEKRLQFAEDALRKDSIYWSAARHEQLSPVEFKTYDMIDTVRKIPFIKNGAKVLYFLLSGYVSVGPVDIGNYMSVYARNEYEGDRIRVGFRTNEKFSDTWIVRGYGAYGFNDEKFKYNLQLEKIISRFPWTKAGIQYRNDIDQVGTGFEYSKNSIVQGSGNNTLYNTSSQIGNVSKLVWKQESRAWFEREVRKGITPRITLQNIQNTALFDVYYGDNPLAPYIDNNYDVTEIELDVRVSFDELYVQNGNERMSLGNRKTPVVNFNYTTSLDHVLGSDFSYHKATISLSQRIKMGTLGYSRYSLKAGKVFSAIPYTLLEVHRGNQTVFFTTSAFNLMNYFEFVSDQFVELYVQHNLRGLLFNRLPLIKKLNLREVFSFHAVYGSLSQKNKLFNANNFFTELSDKPYMETGFGIENFLDIFRIDFIYRLSYADKNYISNYTLNNPGKTISNFGIKFSLQLGL